MAMQRVWLRSEPRYVWMPWYYLIFLVLGLFLLFLVLEPEGWQEPPNCPEKSLTAGG